MERYYCKVNMIDLAASKLLFHRRNLLKILIVKIES